MNTMKVSIIIPVYNAEKFIESCIESALNQSYKDIEIIAIDDGSTDSSLKILEKFQDRIKIIHKENGGTSTALNTGIKEMTGDWFKWLSADDILYPNAVEELIKESQKITDKTNVIFYSNYDIIDSKGEIIKQFIEPDYNELPNFNRNVILLDGFYGNGITTLIHKSIFEKCGFFDEKIGFQEDYEFWLRCCLLYDCRLHLISQNLAQYRVHQGQLTHTKGVKSLAQANYIKKYVLAMPENDFKIEYKIALKKYRKHYPIKIKIYRKIRNILFPILPKRVSNKIIHIYKKRRDVI